MTLRSVRELTVRRTVCDSIIRELNKMDDPRKQEALDHYTEQLRYLDAELTEATRLERESLGIPEPEPIIVGLKTAKIFGKTK